MLKFRGWVICLTLLWSALTQAQVNNNSNHKLKLELPSLAVIRVIDNGVVLSNTSAPILLTPNTSSNSLIAGESAENLFPFTSSPLFLQYTYVPIAKQNGNSKKAKITVTRSAFVNPSFQTETRLFITTKSGTYHGAFNAPLVAGGVNSGVKTKVVKTNNKRIIRDINPGWTGIGNNDGNEIIYSWELKNNGDMTSLAGLSETVTVTFTITEQ